MRSLAVILCGASIVSAPADEPPSVDNIINEWRFACRQVHSVAGNVQLASFDDDLHIQRNAAGRFRFASAEEGFWKLTPLDDLPVSRRKRLQTGIPYKYERYKPTHCRWSADLVYEVNDSQKEFVVSRVSPTDGPLLAQFNIGNCHTPFLPGLPNDISVAQWSFTVVRQTRDHVFLRATPRVGNPFARTTRSCFLILQKDPIRLLATRSTSPAGQSSVSLVFSGVQVNPTMLPWPSLSDYKAVSSNVQP